MPSHLRSRFESWGSAVDAKLEIPDPLSFSNEESFGLFMEGLRALQLYEDETSKEHPRRSNLERWMQDALDCLRDCVSHYSFDLLPRFSLGVVLSMRNQEVYVERLQQVSPACVAAGQYLAYRDQAHDPEISAAERAFAQQRAGEESERASPYWDLAHRPWPLLKEGGDFFESLRTVSNPRLRRVAAYNLAQLFGRRGPTYLEQGIEVLTAPEAQRVAEPVEQDSGTKTGQKQSLLNSLNVLLSSAADRESARRVRLEDAALDLQFDCLLESLRVRIAARDISSAPNNFKAIYAAFEDVGARIEDVDTIDDLGLKRDLQADFLTKLGYIDYERALNPALTSPSFTATECLDQAATSFRQALEHKEHWNPAQIYLATVRRLQSGTAEAYIQHLRRRLPSADSDQRESLEREINNSRQMQQGWAQEAEELFAILRGEPVVVAAPPNVFGDG
jgi:hypothetical protein